MIITVKNDQTEVSPKTLLAANLAASGTTIYVKGINGFSDNWNVQIGKTGEERTQIIEISGDPSGSAINLAGTIKDTHPIDTPVYCLKYNQIIFKRSTSGTAGTATAMTDGTTGIQADSEITQFDDSSGSAGYGYKVSYYSTGLASESSESDWITTGGHDFYSLAKIRGRAKNKALNVTFTDNQWDEWVNEWLASNLVIFEPADQPPIIYAGKGYVIAAIFPM